MRIAIIGAGNVATHLAEILSDFGEVCQVVARTQSSASRLASLINDINSHKGRGNHVCKAEKALENLRSDCDWYLIAVNDDSIRTVVDSTPDFPGIWTHTSGSVGMGVFSGRKSNFGVFYPLQTFSRDIPVDFSNVPIMIEGSSCSVCDWLKRVAGKISSVVTEADSHKREAIHVAAVFACNFANLMWLEADRLLKSQDLDIRYMKPLLQATLDKLERCSPFDAMTGPARRCDLQVIDKHLTSLPADLKPVYALLSEKILELYNSCNPKKLLDEIENPLGQ